MNGTEKLLHDFMDSRSHILILTFGPWLPFSSQGIAGKNEHKRTATDNNGIFSGI